MFLIGVYNTQNDLSHIPLGERSFWGDTAVGISDEGTYTF